MYVSLSRSGGEAEQQQGANQEIDEDEEEPLAVTAEKAGDFFGYGFRMGKYREAIEETGDFGAKFGGGGIAGGRGGGGGFSGDGEEGFGGGARRIEEEAENGAEG